MIALALAGIADAFYVARASYTGQLMWCPSWMDAIPSPRVRTRGFCLAVFSMVALLDFDPLSRGLRLGALLYAAIGVSYSIYGMYVQLSLIEAACIYCLISGVDLGGDHSPSFHHRVPALQETRVAAVIEPLPPGSGQTPRR
jgi:hypothetical protein